MKSSVKKSIFILIIVTTEFIIFGLLGYFIYQKISSRTKVLGEKTITTMNKNNLIFSDSSHYKYYFRLTPNTTETANPEWLGYTATYSYNADGLNDLNNYTIDKPANTFRIITLGDSFTFGQLVNTADNWTERLENLLKSEPSKTCPYTHFEVINLGMPAFDIPYITHRYETIGSKYSPDLIIWFESGTGFSRNDELLFPLINECQAKEATSSSNSSDKAQYFRCWENASNELYSKKELTEVTEILRQNLDSFLQKVDNNKIIFYTFKDNGLVDYEQKTWNKWSSMYPNIQFSAIIPNIYARKETLPDTHPSKQGHTTISDTIFDDLKKKTLRNCFIQ